MPSEFIPVAEETRLIIPIGISVLEQICREFDQFDREVMVSVNLSLRQLEDPDLVPRLESILANRTSDRWRLQFEITESAVMEDAEAAIETFSKIRDLGVDLCIDDFGTGYSSLSYLIDMPIQTLKIDRSFIANFDRGRGQEMVRTIITLARNLGMTTIAEGVETAEQMRRLIAYDCDYAQGFLFGQPRALAEAIL